MPTRSRTGLTALAAIAVTAPLLLSAAAAEAAPTPKRYANCTALTKDYKHGVARSSAVRDRTRSGSRGVTTFAVNAKVYQLNITKDRDKDGIACER